MEIEKRHEVMRRDKACVLSFLEEGHECRDVLGRKHDPDAIWLLTIEHVKEHLMMGRRAPSEPRWMVALCGTANLRPPTKEQREKMREYLAAAYADAPPIRKAG